MTVPFDKREIRYARREEARDGGASRAEEPRPYSYSVMSVGIARALGCRGQANLGALDTFRHVQSSKNSSARGCKKKCQWKTRFVLLDRSRDISREERITGPSSSSMNKGSTHRPQVTAPHPSPAPAGTRYPTPSPPGTAAATTRCR